jgi:hypothetical protein
MMDSNGIMFITNWAKIGHLVPILNWGTHKHVSVQMYMYTHNMTDRIMRPNNYNDDQIKEILAVPLNSHEISK